MMRVEAWIIITTICATLFQTILTQTHPSPADFEVTCLPEQPSVDPKPEQYAGYVNITEKFALFFYFVKAEVKAETRGSKKPLVLWLNGGPGCSSVGLGAFTGSGPFRVFKENGEKIKLAKNEDSWNKEANMLYLDSPAGTGYSLPSEENVNDTITAEYNLQFLEKWLEIFKEYKGSPFFITGESYASHYATDLANLMFDRINKPELHLQGIALGNPLLNLDTDLNSRPEYFWSHGMISDSTYDKSKSKCNYSRMITDGGDKDCKGVKKEYNKAIGTIDLYDIALDVCPRKSSILSQFMKLNKQRDNEKMDICVEKEITNYLNEEEVQRELHAERFQGKNWKTCVLDKDLKYGVERRRLIIPVLSELMKKHNTIRVLIYSGDQDAVVPLTGTRQLVNDLAKDLRLKTNVPYKPWPKGNKVSGWRKDYGGKSSKSRPDYLVRLSFATVKGAGHSVPQTQSGRSLELIKTFLNESITPKSRAVY